MKTSLGAKTIALPTPAWVVGTYDQSGTANAMTIAWGGICCSKPPCLTISLRKATYTYGNIMARKAYTVNIPSRNLVGATDYLGLYSGRDENKLAALGLAASKSDLVDAPVLDDFPVNIECRVIHVLEIDLHTMFVGEILDVKANANVLTPENKISVGELAPFVYAPDSRHYYGIADSIAPAFSVGLKKK